VTRARRARRARLRASRPVAARAASRTRFGTSSRRVSIKARREACFTRFAFSRVLFFHAFCFFIGFGSSRFRSFVKISKKKKKKKKKRDFGNFVLATDKPCPRCVGYKGGD
jgi:hypothetical protein